MELKDMTIEQLEERKAAIASEIETDGADLDALENEVRSIKAELEARANEEAKKVELRKTVAEMKFNLNRHLPRAYAQMDPSSTEPAAPNTVTTRLLSSETDSKSRASL